MKLLVTGGAGFIGSSVIRYLMKETDYKVLNIDKLTYAGNLESLKDIFDNSRYFFKQIDICNTQEIEKAIFDFKPNAIMHLAAESHVDRSIDGPREFINTNILGTYTLLETSRKYWSLLTANDNKSQFRFHHISTDEVYGSLGKSDFFTEKTSYKPNSPYSASKASSDHLVRAWYHTYGFPVVTTNCSNNYGPYQFPEKLIPLMIINAISGKPLPIYGKGDNIRDWLYVDDHAKALLNVLENGRLGETYNIGGLNEKTNLEIVHSLCEILDKLLPDSPYIPHKNLITYVTDRPGHDKRYAIDANKIKVELGWEPIETFDTGLYKTVKWYLANKQWWENILNGSYKGERLGLKRTKV